MALEIYQIPAFDDNYLYVIRCSETGKVAAVDPGDSEPILDFLKQKKWQLDYIFNTHHHHDHIGGNEILRTKYDCKIFASEFDSNRIANVNRKLNACDEVQLGNVSFKVLFVPGHTLGHIAYWCESENVLFIGDTLFSYGCGRLFEGTPEMMFASLEQIKKLPPETKIYCAHEYTESNLHFWTQYLPKRKDLYTECMRVKSLRENNIGTVPFTLNDEFNKNPFLQAKSVLEFAKLREARNHA